VIGGRGVVSGVMKQRVLAGANDGLIGGAVVLAALAGCGVANSSSGAGSSVVEVRYVTSVG
jgi:hypothetical protein